MRKELIGAVSALALLSGAALAQDAAMGTENGTPSGSDIIEGEINSPLGAEGASNGSNIADMESGVSTLETPYNDQVLGSEADSSPDVATGNELEDKMVAPDIGNSTKNGADISSGDISPSADLQGAAEGGMTRRLQGDLP